MKFHVKVSETYLGNRIGGNGLRQDKHYMPSLNAPKRHRCIHVDL